MFGHLSQVLVRGHIMCYGSCNKFKQSVWITFYGAGYVCWSSNISFSLEYLKHFWLKTLPKPTSPFFKIQPLNNTYWLSTQPIECSWNQKCTSNVVKLQILVAWLNFHAEFLKKKMMTSIRYIVKQLFIEAMTKLSVEEHRLQLVSS